MISATLACTLAKAPLFSFQQVEKYTKWVTEDVTYIIAPDEFAAWIRLTTDDERDHFVDQFWARRDPTPGTARNEFKEEHYRRIAFANEAYRSIVPGSKTDRGRIYIVCGPPDMVEAHPTGSETSSHPFQKWFYRGAGRSGAAVIIEFVDKASNGDYRLN